MNEKGHSPKSYIQHIYRKIDSEILRKLRTKDVDSKDFFTVSVRLYDFHATARARKHHSAIQEACREILHQIVDSKEKVRHEIYGKTKEESHEFINSLKPLPSNEESQENVVSKLNEHCAKYKLVAPKCEFDVDKGLHVCIATFEGNSYTGMARTKKEAQRMAYADIYNSIINSQSLPEPKEAIVEIADILQAVPLANYLQRVVVDQPPMTTEDFEQGGFPEILQQLTEYRNPDGERLFESIEYFDERKEKRRRAGYSALAVEKPTNAEDRPKEIVTLMIENLLLRTSANPRRGNCGFFVMGQRMESVRGEVAWKALRYIYNYSNFRTTGAMPKKMMQEIGQSLDQPTISGYWLDQSIINGYSSDESTINEYSLDWSTGSRHSSDWSTVSGHSPDQSTTSEHSSDQLDSKSTKSTQTDDQTNQSAIDDKKMRSPRKDD